MSESDEADVWFNMECAIFEGSTHRFFKIVSGFGTPVSHLGNSVRSFSGLPLRMGQWLAGKYEEWIINGMGYSHWDETSSFLLRWLGMQFQHSSAGTDWQHLLLSCGRIDTGSIHEAAQYLFVITFMTPLLALVLVCWYMELRCLFGSICFPAGSLGQRSLFLQLHYLSLFHGVIYTMVHLLWELRERDIDGNDMAGAEWGVHILAAIQKGFFWLFALSLMGLTGGYGWIYFRHRRSIPMSTEAKTTCCNSSGMKFMNRGLRALIVCTCILKEDGNRIAHNVAPNMPRFEGFDLSPPCGDHSYLLHQHDGKEGLCSWEHLDLPLEKARSSWHDGKLNRAGQFWAVYGPSSVNSANAILSSVVSLPRTTGRDRCLTRGLGGSYPLTCPFHSDLSHQHEKWDILTEDFSLMQSSSWRPSTSREGYPSRGHDLDAALTSMITESLPRAFWQQIQTTQEEFSDVHLYFHGLKGRHVATRTLSVYGKKKKILPGLQNRIERLWRDHFDRRESFELHYVEPQPQSAVVNGQVHVIVDLWPSLHGFPVLSHWTTSEEPGCALQSHRLQTFVPFDEILREENLPRELVNGVRVQYAHKNTQYGRHEFVRFSAGARMDFELTTEPQCPADSSMERPFVADFTIDPLQDTLFLMQVRPLMEDMLTRHVRRVLGGNIRADVLTWMHHAEHIQQLQRDLRIVTHNPDLPLGHNIRSRWSHTFGRRPCYIFPVWPSPNSGRGPEPHFIVTTYIGQGLVPALIEYETDRSFKQASFVFRVQNWLTVHQIFDLVKPENQCIWRADCTLRCGENFFEWHQHVPLYEGIRLRMTEIERDDTTDGSTTCESSEELDQRSRVETVSSQERSEEEEHVSFMQSASSSWQEEFEMEEASFQRALAELPVADGGTGDERVCIIPAANGLDDAFRTFLDQHFLLADIQTHTVYTWIVSGQVAAAARVCVIDVSMSATRAVLLEWSDTEQDWPLTFAVAEPQPAPLSLRRYPIDVVGLLHSQRLRGERVFLIDILYVGHPRRVAVLCQTGDRLFEIVQKVGLGHYCQLEGVNCFLTWYDGDEGQVWEMDDLVEEKHASAFQLHLRGQPCRRQPSGIRGSSFMQRGFVRRVSQSVLNRYASQWFSAAEIITFWIHPANCIVQEHSAMCDFRTDSDVFEQCASLWKDIGLREYVQVSPIEPPPIFMVIPRPHVIIWEGSIDDNIPILCQVFFGRRTNLVSILLEGRYPPIGVASLFLLASPQNDCDHDAICYAVYHNERYQYYHDIPIAGGTFVKLYEFPQESDSSTVSGSCSTATSADITWQEDFTGENTATPGEQLEAELSEENPIFDGFSGENTATPAIDLHHNDMDITFLFQGYATQRAYHVDVAGLIEEEAWTGTDEEWEELIDTLSFHTSVFGFEKLNAEAVAYYDAFGVYPTFEVLFVNGRLTESTFQFQEQNWNREMFITAVRLFLEAEIDRQEFSAVAYVHEIPTPYEQRGMDHIFLLVERSYAPLRIMVCVVIIFDLDDPPEIHALSVPQYVWSKDLVRDVQMDGVCRDPRFDCFLRHGLLEMPTLVAWQPYQGMKLNLDIKMLSCERRAPGYSIMPSQESVVDDYGLEERDEDGVFLMQQQASLGSESEMPSTLSTHRNDTESLCNGYFSRGPTDVAPHFTNQVQQLEELREWLLELLGSDTSITLYVFERNDGDVATYRISIRAEVLRGGPRFAHWIRRELAALWNVHARIFPLVPAPFADLRIAVPLPRAFGRDLPILLEINDGHDSWREIHVVQQGVTINSLLWRSRLPQVVPSTQVYQAMLAGETAEPHDLVPWSPGQWVTIAVGHLGHLGGNATTDSFPDPWLPSLTSLATSRTGSSRNDEQTGDPSQVGTWSGGDEHTLMQWFAIGNPQPNEICTWLLKWEQRGLIQEQSRIVRVFPSQDLHAQILQVWRDECEADCPWVIPVSLHIQQAGIQVPAFFVLDYISPLSASFC